METPDRGGGSRGRRTWENPEDFEKLNSVLRYSQGSALRGFNVTAMAYDAKWNSTDQIPQRAVDKGLIPRFGAIDTSDGGQTSRYSLSFEGTTPLNGLGGPQFQIDAFVIGYNLDLGSNFTYFLDNETQGDQFHQADRRQIYGLRPNLAWAGKLWGAESTSRVGLQIRYDDIGRYAHQHRSPAVPIAHPPGSCPTKHGRRICGER
jgi:hypothetical protein